MAKSQANAAMANPRMLQETVEKSGKTYHQETDWENGTKDVIWFYQGYVLILGRSGPPDQVRCISGTDKYAPRRPQEDFPELSWINAKAFSGTTTYNGVDCYLYTKTEPDLGTTSAWIDMKTRLPVAVDSPKMLSTYAFSAGPDSLVPQGIFAARWERLQKALYVLAHPTVPL